MAALQVDAAGRDAIAAIPQRTLEWKAARVGRLTASNFGAAINQGPPGSQRTLLLNMLYPELSELKGKAKEFAKWGTDMEPVARDVYELHRREAMEAKSVGGGACLRVYETGLLVCVERGWLASSPDFVVEEPRDGHERGTDSAPPANEFHERAPYKIPTPAFQGRTWTGPPARTDFDAIRGCGEIKCPATHKLYSSDPKHAKYGFPAYYYAQIQGVCAINGWPFCDVVVFTPTVTEITRFYRNAVYWDEVLLPGLTKFYFKDFLPRMQLKAQGRLRYGEVDPVMVLPGRVGGFVPGPAPIQKPSPSLAEDDSDRQRKRTRFAVMSNVGIGEEVWELRTDTWEAVFTRGVVLGWWWDKTMYAPDPPFGYVEV